MTRHTRLFLCGLLLISLALAGCRPAPVVVARMIDTQVPSPVTTVTPQPTPAGNRSIPAETPAATQDEPAGSQLAPVQLPVFPISNPISVLPTPDAILLELPPQGIPGGTDWRPPLYPIPWAVGVEDHFYFIRPILADEKGWLLDDYKYGYTYEGFDNVHTGIDIDASTGTPVYAAAAGTVIWSGYGLLGGHPDPDDPYGLAIAIRHDFGFKDQRLYTLYAHLSQAEARVGDLVDTGQQIGLVGVTGASTGPHLHFEVRVGENGYFQSRNPELWLAPAQGWGLLVGQIKDTAGRLLKGKPVYITQVDGEKHWTAITYGARSINSDDYYQENLVLSDLPAGQYKVTYEYLYQRYYLDVEILPGQVTYFSFQGRQGFSTALPSAPGAISSLTTP